MVFKDLFNKKKPEERLRAIRRTQMQLNRVITGEEAKFNKIKQEQAGLIDNARSADRVTRDIAKRKYKRLKIQRERTLKNLRMHLGLKSVVDAAHDELTAQRNRSSPGKIKEDLIKEAGLDAATLENLLVENKLDEEMVTDDINELESVLSQAADEDATNWEEAEDTEWDSIMEAVSTDGAADVVKLVDEASTRNVDKADPQANR